MRKEFNSQMMLFLVSDFRFTAKFPKEIIGDRSIHEKDFGRIQMDRVLEMQKWANNIKTVEDERTKLTIVAANNHFAGFGPGTANIFRNMMGLPEAKWEEKEEESEQQQENRPARDSDQRTLSDFLN